MRNGLPLAGTVFALVLATVVAAGAEERAIDFEATTLDGGVFDARELEGKIVLLDFWAVWCPPCIAAMPALSRLDRELGPRGFDVVGVAVHSGSPEDVAGFLEDKDVTYSVVVGDEDLTERFEVIGFPTYFLIDTDGRIFKKYVGEIKTMKVELERDIQNLLARRSTRP